MVETLTESFCERCGTRYEFRAPTRLNPLRKTRGFIGGLRNYLTSQDAMSDAMGDAMRSEEDQLASAQLDAFHETFNFCIGCRQYTCINCWNDGDGRCRTCAPIAGTDDLTERLLAIQPGALTAAASAAVAEPEPTLGGDEISRRLGLDTWPGDGAAAPAANGDGAHAWPDADPLTGAAGDPVVEVPAEPEPIVETTVEAPAEIEPMVAEIGPQPELTLEPVVADEAQPWGEPETWSAPEPEPAREPEPVAAAEPEPVAAPEPEPWPAAAEIQPEPEAEPVAATVEESEAAVPYLRVVAWEADAAYQVDVEALEPEPTTAIEEEQIEEAAPAAEAEPEPLVAEVTPEPEAVVVEAEAEPEPETAVEHHEHVAAADEAPRPVPQVAPIRETILRFPDRPTTPEADQPAVAAEADSPELAARRAQLDLLGLGDPGEGPVAPDRPAVLPYRSRGAAATQAEMAMRAGGGFWEASAREVAGAAVAQVGVQNCGECGLSLSASARFCRRCGTSQARSA